MELLALGWRLGLVVHRRMKNVACNEVDESGRALHRAYTFEVNVWRTSNYCYYSRFQISLLPEKSLKYFAPDNSLPITSLITPSLQHSLTYICIRLSASGFNLSMWCHSITMPSLPSALFIAYPMQEPKWWAPVHDNSSKFYADKAQLIRDKKKRC